jgi:oxygen-independent coproporphyrinogen III oxidase
VTTDEPHNFKLRSPISGLYLHIPFCERKCVYCAFYSVETLDAKERFLRAIAREIEMRADELADDPDAPAEYSTIFFGGGTPSILSPDELARIMEPLRRRFAIADGAELTMEANPGALTKEWLEGYRDLGVNRMSFGVQTFHDDELKFLSRIHTADEARASIREARRVFDNVSLDLIFALPGQSVERWLENLRQAVALETVHVSAYSLIFEEGTPLNAMKLKGTVRPAPEDDEAEMYERTVEVLGAHGFAQYEVSNYARPGRECRHNLGYWERRSYISFGPSAHALKRGAEHDLRWANISNITAYLDAIENGRLPVASTEVVGRETAMEELVMLGLRSSGIDLAEFRRLYGGDLEAMAPAVVRRMLDGGFARISAGRLALSAAGYIFADRFAFELIEAAERASTSRLQTTA